MYFGRLIFHDQLENHYFEISSENLSQTSKESILEFFKSDKEISKLMEEYLELLKRERELNQKRKQILTELKNKYSSDEFQQQLMEHFPEMLI